MHISDPDVAVAADHLRDYVAADLRARTGLAHASNEIAMRVAQLQREAREDWARRRRDSFAKTLERAEELRVAATNIANRLAGGAAGAPWDQPSFVDLAAGDPSRVARVLRIGQVEPGLGVVLPVLVPLFDGGSVLEDVPLGVELR